jgi:spore coat-associated protein N
MMGVSISRLLWLAAIVAVVAACAASGFDRREQPPQAVLTQATGDLRLSNSHDGQAIFQASGLAPGRSVSGTVQLANSGTLPGDLVLQQVGVSDRPGPGGGRLSDVVHLAIADVTGGSSIPVFSGALKGLGSRPLGAIGPGEARTFRFTATLPDSGNAFAGSGLTVRYAWNATSSGETGPSDVGGQKPVATFKVNSKKLLKRGIIDVRASCNVACRVSAYAQLPKLKRGKKAVKTRTRRAALNIPNKTARIRLKVSTKAKRQLATLVKKKRRAVVKVRLRVSPIAGGQAVPYTKKTMVMRAKAKRGR